MNKSNILSLLLAIALLVTTYKLIDMKQDNATESPASTALTPKCNSPNAAAGVSIPSAPVSAGIL